MTISADRNYPLGIAMLLASGFFLGVIAGAGIDHFKEEPLPANSPFWGLDNLLITPHSAGETRKYEDNVIDILVANLDKLWAGNTDLNNRIV